MKYDSHDTTHQQLLANTLDYILVENVFVFEGKVDGNQWLYVRDFTFTYQTCVTWSVEGLAIGVYGQHLPMRGGTRLLGIHFQVNRAGTIAGIANRIVDQAGRLESMIGALPLCLHCNGPMVPPPGVLQSYGADRTVCAELCVGSVAAVQ